MDQELLKKYYEDLLGMFSSPGWEEFLKDVDRNIDSVDNLAAVQNDRDLCFRQGSLEVLKWVKAYPDLVKLAYDENFGKAREDDPE